MNPMKKNLSQVTLIGVDGLGSESILMDRVLNWCMKWFDFGVVLHISGGSISCEYNGIQRLGVPRMNTPSDYNKFCVYELANHTTTEFCMIVHTDGFITNPHLWHDSFLENDYIGAPWYMGCTTHWENIVGNGGFSIRSKKFLEYSRSFRDYDGTRNEDLFLCVDNYHKAISFGLKIADTDLAANFSVETLSDRYPTIDESFGFHGKNNLPAAMRLTNNLGMGNSIR